MLHHPLAQLTDDVRRRARRVLLAHAGCLVAGVALLAVLVACLLDAWIRRDDVILRGLLLAGVFGAIGWAVWRWLLPALRYQPADVEIARRIERRFPDLRDRLASSVDFLLQEEHAELAGSAGMRRAVIVDATSAVEGIRAEQVVETRPAARMAMFAAAALLAVIIIAAIRPDMIGLAVARLWQPWGGESWPRDHELAFRDPVDRIAYGQTFEVELVDLKGELPDEVKIIYRYADGRGDGDETERMQFVGGVMVARKRNVTRPFAYRATGGDDDTLPWIHVEVVEPPCLEYAEVTVTPPAYTGWAPQQAEVRVRGLRGSRVEFAVGLSAPIESAALVLETGPRVPAEIAPDGRSFKIAGERAITLDKNDRYWFELIDREGLKTGAEDRFDLIAVVDTPPAVAIEQPSASVYLTPEAQLPLRVVVKENLAINKVLLRFTRSDHSDEGEQDIELFAGPPQPVVVPGGLDAAQGERRTIDYLWKLDELSLPPKTQLVLHAIAADYQPQSATSDERRITIITPDELRDRLAQRQSAVLAELQRLLKQQQEVRGQVQSLQTQAADVGKLRRRDVELLQGAELNQRQIARGLGDGAEGVVVQIEGLLAELRYNRVDNAQLQERIERLRAEVLRIAKAHLPVVERELIAARKSVQSARPSNAAAAEVQYEIDDMFRTPLAAAASEQDQIIAALERLLDDLGQWRNYRELSHELTQLRGAQQQTQRDTLRLGEATLGKGVAQLDAQQLADLKGLEGRQADLLRRFEKIEAGLNTAAAALRESNASAAGTLVDALDLAHEGQIAKRLREAADMIRQNQTKVAAEQQNQAIRAIDEVLDVLAGRREQELSRRLKKLRDAEAQLAGIRERQAKATAAAKAVAGEQDEAARRVAAERLADEERALADEVARLQRQLQRLTADDAASDLEKAAEKIAAAAKGAGQGDAAAAAEKGAGADQDLAAAGRKLAARTQKAEADLAHEQLGKVEDALQGLHSRQKRLLDDTIRLEQLKQEGGDKRTRGQDQSVQDLARTQMQVRGETDELAAKIEAAKVFRRALDSASVRQQQAAEALDALDTGERPQSLQRGALDRFEQIAASLKQDKEDGGEEKPGQGEEKQPDQPGGSQIGSRSELKLLLLMQEDVAARTAAIEKRYGGATELPADAEREYAELSREQGELADLVLKLAPEEKPVDKDKPRRLRPSDLEKPADLQDNSDSKQDQPLPDDLEKEEAPK